MLFFWIHTRCLSHSFARYQWKITEHALHQVVDRSFHMLGTWNTPYLWLIKFISYKLSPFADIQNLLLIYRSAFSLFITQSRCTRETCFIFAFFISSSTHWYVFPLQIRHCKVIWTFQQITRNKNFLPWSISVLVQLNINHWPYGLC